MTTVAALLRRVHSLEIRMSRLRAEQVEALAGLARAAEQDPAYAVPDRPVDAGPWAPLGSCLPSRYVADDLAAWMTWTTYRAEQAIAEATRLCADLPATLCALAAGRIDHPRAQVVVRAVALLDSSADPDNRHDPSAVAGADAAAVDAALGPVAASMTTAALRVAADREVLAVDPGAADRRYRRARTGRHLYTRPLGDGIAALTAVGPATAIAARREDVRAHARSLAALPGETRTQAAIEFDLLMATTPEPSGATGEGGPFTSTAQRAPRRAAGSSAGDPSPAGPGGDRLPARIHVTVALPTLLGLDDAPANLSGYGPLPAAIARDLATHPDTTVRRLVTDPFTGTLLGIDGHTHPALAAERQRRDPGSEHASGPGAYQPSAAVARHVITRDPSCTAPSCRQPAARCDLDHITPWPSGPTCPCNLHPLCRRHHLLKHTPGWTVRRAPSGTTTWSTPSGQVTTIPAVPVLPQPRTAPPPRSAGAVPEPPSGTAGGSVPTQRKASADGELPDVGHGSAGHEASTRDGTRRSGATPPTEHRPSPEADPWASEPPF